ncbi:MAG: hypothetical protein R3C32_15725 [Chloroflexota bacterium]
MIDPSQSGVAQATGTSRRRRRILAVIALGAAATLPALVAATRDPLRVLRVP